MGYRTLALRSKRHADRTERRRRGRCRQAGIVDGRDRTDDRLDEPFATGTVRVGAQFDTRAKLGDRDRGDGWHTHAGSVIVSVVEGELVYVMQTDCSEHSYAAGTAFLDPGHGEVHSAYNPTDAPTVIVATFLEAPADGPLVITDGVTAPADNCGMPTS